MTSLYKQFETDHDAETKGIILQFGTTDDGKPINIRIARAGGTNARYQKMVEIKTKPYRRMIENDILDTKVADTVMMEVFAECIVLGWENVLDRDGKEIPYTKEACLALFKQLPDFFKDVQAQAMKSALFRRTLLESDSGN